MLFTLLAVVLNSLLSNNTQLNNPVISATSLPIQTTISPSPQVLDYDVQMTALPVNSPKITLSPVPNTPAKNQVFEPTPKATPTRLPTIEPTATPSSTIRPSPRPKPFKVTPSELENYFINYSQKYAIDVNLLKKIAKCESNFNPNSRTPLYLGMYQFSVGTWIAYRKQMKENPDPELRANAEESIKTAAYMISQGKAQAWPSCY